MSYLDNNGLLYFWNKLKTYFATKSEAITNITRSGTTFTATRADSTTFTFTQQDNDTTYSDATTTTHGLMSTADKAKLDGIAEGATANTGTVTSVATGAGLTGGTITGSGTIKADLKSDTKSSLEAASMGNTSSRQYAVGLDKNGDLSVNVPWTDTKALESMTGTLGVDHGGTGVTTLGAGVVYHSANGTGALSIATAANLVSAIGTTAVNRATADASGNNISDTYAKKTDITGIYKYKGSVAAVSNLPSSPSTGDVYNIESASIYGAAGANVAWNGTAWDSLGEIFTVVSITNAEIDAIVAS